MAELQAILDALPGWRETADRMRDLLLADLVMIGEIPAPTFGEEARVAFIANRFVEAGLARVSVDDKGNAAGILAGTDGRSSLLVTAHADTVVADREQQTVEIRGDRALGPFVGDNSIALAALTILPILLESLGLRLKADLVLLASTRCLGRGNLEGLRYFLAESGIKPRAGFCLESVQLGRLNYSCMGLLRGVIQCVLPPDYNWEQYGSTGTIIPVSDVIQRISRIPLPRRPLSRVIFGSIHGGIVSNNIARETNLAFEARSESQEILADLERQIRDIAAEVASQSGVRIALEVLAHRAPGGLDIGHPLVHMGRSILTALGTPPMLYPTTSQLAALHDAGIPGLTVAVTTGERRNELDEIEESVALPPIATGLTQLAGLLAAADALEAPA